MTATAQSRAQWLISFWQAMAMSSTESNIARAAIRDGRTFVDPARAAQIGEAMLTMKLLVAECVSQPNVRLSAFAASGIFEQALLLEDGRWTGVLLDAARAGRVDAFTLRALLAGDRNLRSPRQIMLDGIYGAGTAGVFSIKDPSGMTTWLKSTHAAGIAVIAAVKGDPDGGVRAALLKLLRDVAVPAEIARTLKEERTFEALAELLPGSTFPVETRRTIQALGVEADARMTRELAQFPTFDALPAFPTGDGVDAATLPASLMWYRRPGTWITAIAGLVAGGVAATRTR